MKINYRSRAGLGDLALDVGEEALHARVFARGRLLQLRTRTKEKVSKMKRREVNKQKKKEMRERKCVVACVVGAHVMNFEKKKKKASIKIFD